MQKRLAVLPFTVFSGTPRDKAFGRGLQKTLATKLTQLSSGHSLQLIPVGDLAAQHVETARDARKKFDANLALTGTIEHKGEQFHVSYALMDPSSGFQVSAETLNLPASDPFAIEDKVVEGTAAMLGLEVPPSQRQAIEDHGTTVAGAFQDYILGLGYLEDYDRAENIDKAVESFQSALNVDGAYTLAYAGLGQAYWLKYTTTTDTRWVDRSQQSCSHAATLDPQLPATHLCLGILESGTGRYHEAIQQFHKVLETEPTNYSAYEGLARAQFNLKRISGAEATYRRALSIRPNYWAPYNGLGAMYFKIGQYGKAVEMFSRAIDLDPTNCLAYYNLGGVYLALDKPAEAEKMLKKSIAIQPTAGAYSNLGALTFGEGRFDQSAGYFEKALDLSKKDEMLWGNLADAYKWSSDARSKAIPAFRKAADLARDGLRVNPKSYDLLGRLAFYEAQCANFKQAIRDMRRALSLAPRDVQLIYYAALVYYLAGRRTQALDYLRRARLAGYPVRVIRADPEWRALKTDPEFQKAVGIEKN